MGQTFVRRCSSLGSEEGGGVLCCRSGGGGGEEVSGSCVPAHPVCALQGQGLGLVGGGRAGGAAEGGAVGGRGVTGGVRVLEGGGRTERGEERKRVGEVWGEIKEQERERHVSSVTSIYIKHTVSLTLRSYRLTLWRLTERCREESP